MNIYKNDEKKMDALPAKIQELFRIVAELENDFPERHFTLDGHLVGSIGEVMAEYHYGIVLDKASEKTHDGTVGDRRVQIKLTQRDNILISSKPEYLIVLYLTGSGKIYEVYNGPGAKPWDTARKQADENRLGN